MDQTSELGLPLFLILCGILGMLVLALAVIVFFMIYQKRLFIQQETLLRMERDYQNKLLKYSFESQEAVGKRIAGDLHDDIGSTLSAIRIYVHQLNPDLSIENYQEFKTDTTTLIDNVIDHIRDIASNLFPPNLERFGLVQAVKDLCQRIQKMNIVDIRFDYDEQPKLTKPQELTIYRILQELLNNTLKHAKATEVTIRFRNEIDGFVINFEDNGKGFSMESTQKSSTGLGIKNMESRANSIGAKIRLQSQSAVGCAYELLLPVTSKD